MAALKLAKESGARVTKSSIMLGCGEQPHEILHTFKTLRDNGDSPRLWGRATLSPFCLARADRLSGACLMGLLQELISC